MPVEARSGYLKLLFGHVIGLELVFGHGDELISVSLAKYVGCGAAENR
jgi:hypothetical protein